MRNENLIDSLENNGRLDMEEYRLLLESAADSAVLDYAAARARSAAQRVFGAMVYVRGLIEITNHCRNDCYYCGIRRSNRAVERYRLTAEEILECCREGHGLGFRTFVLQGGEDAGLSDDAITGIVGAIRAEFPDSAITLSLGEKSAEAYRRFFEAGANRYLLRHETASPEHYAMLHPPSMSFERRMEALQTLRAIGFQTGTGMMVGSPGQTLDDLVEDIAFIERFRPQMIGLGPYIPQCDTPLAGNPAGSVKVTLMLLSIFRLMFPRALIPATTALASLVPDGRIRGILAGANVVMPNLSPESMRARYAIYDNKRSFGSEAAEGLRTLAEELATVGYEISFERGDYNE
jgi:biotin synthase